MSDSEVPKGRRYDHVYLEPVEEEVRHILRTALAEKERGPANLFEAIRRRIAPLRGVELDIPRREPVREPPRFQE